MNTIDHNKKSPLARVELPAGLFADVLARVHAEQAKAARRTFFVFVGVVSFSFVAMIPALWYLYRSVTESGIFQYMTLIFSDSAMALTYWREFSLLIAESLPLVGLVAFLSAAGLFLWSFRKALGARGQFVALAAV